MKTTSIAVFVTLAFLFAACGPSPEAQASQTAAAASQTAAAASATQDAISRAATATYAASAPKSGHWAGESSVSFDIDPDGNITNFSMTIDLAPVGKCNVSSREVAIEVQEDRTFSFVFGDSTSTPGDENTIRGKFTSSTAVTGSYSKLIFCAGSSGRAVISSRNEEGTWTAKWTSP